MTRWIGGQRLVVRRGMTGATGNLYYGLHEFMSMGLVLHFLRDGDLFLDAGANVGSYTVLASGVCRARTLAIEADPDTARDLARNVAINGLQELVTIEVLALGPCDGEVMFTTGLGAMNQVVSERREGVRIVPQKTLDHVVGDRQPALLKLDVEKYEDQVLQGSIEVLKKPSLKVVALEATSDRRPGLRAGLLRSLHARPAARAQRARFLRRQVDALQRVLRPRLGLRRGAGEDREAGHGAGPELLGKGPSLRSG